jgi:dimethylsulfoniopropionate demethylase
MTRADNPLECGLERYCQLDGSLDYIGRDALLKIAEDGPRRMIRGLLFDGDACPACQHPWRVTDGQREVGYVSSAIWSPRFEQNVALAMIDRGYWEAGRELTVLVEGQSSRSAVITDLPMGDR